MIMKGTCKEATHTFKHHRCPQRGKKKSDRSPSHSSPALYSCLKPTWLARMPRECGRYASSTLFHLHEWWDILRQVERTSLLCAMCVCLCAEFVTSFFIFHFIPFGWEHMRLLFPKHPRLYRHTHIRLPFKIWHVVLIVHAFAKLVSQTTHQQSWLATLLSSLLARPLLRQAPTRPGLEPFLEPAAPGQWLTCTAPPARTPAWATTLALLVPNPAPASDTALL